MESKITEAHGNTLLASLPADALAELTSRMLTKPVSAGEILAEPGAPLIHLIFPHDCIVSLQAVLEDGRTVEKASVGRDGVIGFDYFLGLKRSYCHASVAISGRASWLAISDFQDVLGQSEDVAPMMRGYARKFMAGLMQSIVCASVHSASQRLATWLLRAHDRSRADQFDLTQRALANVFGLRLATISDACSRLGAAGAISHGRGTLSVVDRENLLSQACECYTRGWSNGFAIPGEDESRAALAAGHVIIG